MIFGLPKKRPFGLSKREMTFLLFAHLVIALLMLSPFLPGPGTGSSRVNALFSFLQLLSLPLLLLVPVGVLWYMRASSSRARLYSLLLWTLPVMLLVHCVWSAPCARERSRARAIARSEPLLHALAAYQAKYHRYPEELQELIPRFLPQLPSPWVLGIAGYVYEPHEGDFQVSFSQNVLLGFNYEVVVYDPHNHQQAAGELSTLYPAGASNWQYYLYD